MEVDECPACGDRMQPVLVHEPGALGADTEPGPLLADPPVRLVCGTCSPKGSAPERQN